MKKHNYSRKREAILNLICSTTVHPTAEWVYQQLKPVFPDLSLGTVYRNIAQFKEDGLIMSVGVVNGQERLDGNAIPHTHFICSDCGEVLDLEKEFLPDQADNEIENEFGLQVFSHELTFYGRCFQCRKPI